MSAKELIEKLQAHPELLDLPVTFFDYEGRSTDELNGHEFSDVSVEVAADSPIGELKPYCFELTIGK